MSWHVCMQEIPLNECVQTHRPLSNDDHQSQSISLSASLNFYNNLFYIILMLDRLCIIMCMNNAMTVENYTIWEKLFFFVDSLRWRHNGCDGVSNHQPRHCLLDRLFRLHVTGLCAGNSPGTGEFPTQMASSAENVSISWRHHVTGP